MRIHERNNSEDTWVRKEGGAGADLGIRTEIPLQLCRDPPAAHGGPHVGTGGCLKEAVSLWEAHAGRVERGASAGAGLVAGIDHVESTSLFLKDCAEETHAGVVCEELQSEKNSHWRSLRGTAPM